MWDTYFFSIYSDKLMLPDDISGSIKRGQNEGRENPKLKQIYFGWD